jgi:hypothetical protein
MQDRALHAVPLDLGEGQLVFEALAELPFKHVYALIGKLNSQANAVAAQGDPYERQVYMLEGHELKLVLQALGGLPFNRVHGLLTRLNELARQASVASAREAEPHARP